MSTPDGFLRRVLAEAEDPDLIIALADRLRPPDLRTLLLEVFSLRAHRVSPAHLLRNYESNPFVRPADQSVRSIEDRVLAQLPSEFDIVSLSPVLPFGSHSALGGVSQNNVLTTIRSTEVAADPTMGLAFEAASRRRILLARTKGSADLVRLAAIQRVIRGQPPRSARQLAHFTVFGMVTAGRDTGGLEFESTAAIEHARFLVGATRACAAPNSTLSVELTDLRGGRVQDTLAAIADDIGPTVDTVIFHARQPARNDYYEGLSLKVRAEVGPDMFEVADGGLVAWTQRLLGNRKERLMISGVGLERLATFAQPPRLARDEPQ